MSLKEVILGVIVLVSYFMTISFGIVTIVSVLSGDFFFAVMMCLLAFVSLSIFSFSDRALDRVRAINRK